MSNKENPVKIGVSSCLLGQKVRHDGGSKSNRFLIDIMSAFVEYLPICPEVDIGLGVPRPTIHLVGDPKAPRLVQVKRPEIDLTEKMQKYAHRQMKKLGDLCGYILKKNSPSCASNLIKVYQEPPLPPKYAHGIYAQILMDTYPHLPIEDEGRLMDVRIRENFVERVYVLHRWQTLVNSGLTAKKIVDFHTRHKTALMTHNVSAYQRLGREVAQLKGKNIKEFSEMYIAELMKAFKVIATAKKVANVLYHYLGFLKQQISALDKQELVFAIEQYRLGKLPLIVCLTLFKHHFMHHPNEYIQQQTFLNPYPEEMMLRNAL